MITTANSSSHEEEQDARGEGATTGLLEHLPKRVVEPIFDGYGFHKYGARRLGCAFVTENYPAFNLPATLSIYKLIYDIASLSLRTQ
jgi:hypothetical protein